MASVVGKRDGSPSALRGPLNADIRKMNCVAGYHVAQRLLCHRKPPDGIFYFRDQAALVAMRAILAEVWMNLARFRHLLGTESSGKICMDFRSLAERLGRFATVWR